MSDENIKLKKGEWDDCKFDLLPLLDELIEKEEFIHVIPENRKRMMAAEIMEDFLNHKFGKLIAMPGFKEKFIESFFGKLVDFEEFLKKL